MRPLLTLLLITLAIPVQTHLFSRFPFSFPLDLALIVTYYYGYFHGMTRGMVVGAYLGILTDVLSGELLGTQIFLKTLVGYFSALFGSGILSKDLPIHFLLLVLLSLMNGLLNFFLINLFGESVPFRDAMLRMILPSAGWNALAGSLFLYMSQKRLLKQRSMEVQENGE